MSSASPASSPLAANSTSPPPAASATPPPTTTTPTTASTPPPSPPSTLAGSPPATSPPLTPATSPPSTPVASPPPSSSPPPTSPSGGSPSPPSLSPPSPPSGGATPVVRSRPPQRSGGGRPTPSPPSRPSGSSHGSGSVSDSGGSSGVGTGVIVGVAIAGAAIIAILAIVCVYCTRKKKKIRDDEYGGGRYYASPPPPHHAPPGPEDGHYGVQAQHWQQNYPPPAEHYQVPRPPPPGGPPRPPRGPSPQPPPPPGPYMSISGASGSNFGSKNLLSPPSLGFVLGCLKRTFTYAELATATDGFSAANFLGEGGFGYVHKGVLPNGLELAVKSLKAGSRQGDREFLAEVEIISRVHHEHLVSLFGYCTTGSQRLLVYEFVPNGTLEFHLHGEGQPTMEWPIRLKIALGLAKGLAYLHEDCHPRIIHRDIKAANILLDYNFEAKLADFGMAKLFSDADTHVSTRVVGTFGYMAPEYASSGRLTDKSDVFSFGVVLLELITGRKPFDETASYMEEGGFANWARPLLTKALEDCNFDSVVDSRLENNYSHEEMAGMVACAVACVCHSAQGRPRMNQVVRALKGEASLSDLNGLKPGHSSIYSSSNYDSAVKSVHSVIHSSSDYDSALSGGPGLGL